ncbi:hypothetical protein D9M69_595390 [compost metagenome]
MPCSLSTWLRISGTETSLKMRRLKRWERQASLGLRRTWQSLTVGPWSRWTSSCNRPCTVLPSGPKCKAAGRYSKLARSSVGSSISRSTSNTKGSLIASLPVKARTSKGSGRPATSRRNEGSLTGSNIGDSLQEGRPGILAESHG